MFFLFLL